MEKYHRRVLLNKQLLGVAHLVIADFANVVSHVVQNMSRATIDAEGPTKKLPGTVFCQNPHSEIIFQHYKVTY